MKFVKIELDNFMSYKHQVFEGFDEPGLVLIEGINHDDGGSNGAGKSTVFDAISYALFGQTTRGIKADEVINREVGKDCEVTLEFYMGETFYKVTRPRNYKGRKLRYMRNEEEIIGGTDDITQKKLLAEIGIDFDLFKCTVVFAQEENFNFVNESNRGQKEILGKIMRVDLEEEGKKAKRGVEKLLGQIGPILHEIDTLNYKIATNTIGDLEEESEQWVVNNKVIQDDLENDLENVEKELASVESEHVDIEKLKSVRTKLGERQTELNKSMNEMVVQKGTISNRISDLSKQRDRLNDLTGVCPNCLQEIDELHAGKEAHKLLVVIGIEQDSLKKTDGVIEIIQETKIKEQGQLTTVIERIVKNERLAEKIKLLVEKQTNIQRQLETAKTVTNPWISKIERAKEERSKLENELAEDKKKLVELEEELPYCRFWVNGFGDGGIKSFIFDLICSTLTSRANHYANILTGGKIVISFDTQKKLKSGEIREKFDCEIITGGKKIPYRAYSGGEKRRISLAVDMALSDLMMDYYDSEFNIVVHDEQDFYLDNEGREHYMNLLQEQAKTKKVFVVAHDDIFKAKFDESWVIEKKEDISRLVS